MKTKIIIAIILLFLLCVALEFAVNGLADFPYLKKMFGPKKNVVEDVRPRQLDDIDRSMRSIHMVGTCSPISEVWNENRKEVDDR
jgi:hypothetical protein